MSAGRPGPGIAGGVEPNYDLAGHITSLWAIQDALLQSYRSIFITVQAIFVAVIFAFSQRSSGEFYAALVLFIGLFSNVTWINLSTDRGASVLFLQTLLLRHEDSARVRIQPFRQLRRFQDDLEYRNREMAKGDFIPPDPTRSALNFWLPLSFFAFWIVNAWSHVSSFAWPYEPVELSIAAEFVLAVILLGLFIFCSLFRRCRYWELPFLKLCIPFGVAVVGLSLVSVMS